MDSDSDHFDDDISEENNHRIINDERILPAEPRRRHFRQRKRRKGFVICSTYLFLVTKIYCILWYS